MNLIWNKNLELLKERFPNLYKELEPFFESPAPFTVDSAKSGHLTALWNQKPLHSKYNPIKEAQAPILSMKDELKEKEFKAGIFCGFGLGYGPVEFANAFPSIPLILIEPNQSFFIEALRHIDFTPVFSHPKLILFAGADFKTLKSFLASYTEKDIKLFASPAQTEHASDYFAAIKDCLKQNSKKEEINANTLERFGHLWLKNSCKNLNHLEDLDGIEKYRNLFNFPVTILAAGPSLETILPHLEDIKKRSLVVCVDTSLHACLKQGVEPDFIILVDPQYACWRHLEFLSSPESILITESAAWPSVFRFNCKEIVLCSSLFPIGQYFENLLGSKGKLGAGGSVTTTAWDFARVIGSKEIFLAGMDLGFPKKQTHIRGSQFEEASHRTSKRTKTPESDNIRSLVSANPVFSKDFLGKPLLTDTRMNLFSWWFETNTIRSNTEEGVNTHTLTPESLYINGITPFNIDDFLSRPTIECEKKAFFEKAQERSLKIKEERKNTPSFAEIKERFVHNLEELTSLSKKGMNLCDKAIQNRTKVLEVSSQLRIIDDKIINSQAKDAASLVFPSQRQLEKLSKDIPQDKEMKSIHLSRLIYSQILMATKEYLKYL